MAEVQGVEEGRGLELRRVLARAPADVGREEEVAAGLQDRRQLVQLTSLQLRRHFHVAIRQPVQRARKTRGIRSRQLEPHEVAELARQPGLQLIAQPGRGVARRQHRELHRAIAPYRARRRRPHEAQLRADRIADHTPLQHEPPFRLQLVCPTVLGHLHPIVTGPEPLGTLADAVLGAGGRVTGVIPSALVAKEIAHDGLTDLRVVASMVSIRVPRRLRMSL